MHYGSKCKSKEKQENFCHTVTQRLHAIQVVLGELGGCVRLPLFIELVESGIIIIDDGVGVGGCVGS